MSGYFFVFISTYLQFYYLGRHQYCFFSIPIIDNWFEKYKIEKRGKGKNSRMFLVNTKERGDEIRFRVEGVACRICEKATAWDYLTF
jgi:hypothetical protein